jgi:hypothetical protein
MNKSVSFVKWGNSMWLYYERRMPQEERGGAWLLTYGNQGRMLIYRESASLHIALGGSGHCV